MSDFFSTDAESPPDRMNAAVDTLREEASISLSTGFTRELTILLLPQLIDVVQRIMNMLSNPMTFIFETIGPIIFGANTAASRRRTTPEHRFLYDTPSPAHRRVSQLRFDRASPADNPSSPTAASEDWSSPASSTNTTTLPYDAPYS